MSKNEKILMTIGWAAAGFFLLVAKGAAVQNDELRAEIEHNKANIERANQIVTDYEFIQIIESNDL